MIFQKNKSRPVFFKSVKSVTFRVIVTNIELFRGHSDMLYEIKITILVAFLRGGGILKNATNIVIYQLNFYLVHGLSEI